MPFDSLPSNGGLHNLRALRDHLLQTLPPNFKWDYGHVLRENDCGSAGCALGLAMETMPEFNAFMKPYDDGARTVADVAAWFGIDHDQFTFIFFYVPRRRTVEEIMPAEVAARIDLVLLAYDNNELAHPRASGERRVGGLVPA